MTTPRRRPPGRNTVPEPPPPESAEAEDEDEEEEEEAPAEEKKEPAPPPPGALIKRYKAPVKLDDHRVAALGRESADLTKKVADLRNEKRDAASVYTKQIKEIEKRLGELAEAIRNGVLVEDVDVYEELDHRARKVRIIRADTREVLDERGANETDQLRLVPEEATVVHSAAPEAEKEPA